MSPIASDRKVPHHLSIHIFLLVFLREAICIGTHYIMQQDAVGAYTWASLYQAYVSGMCKCSSVNCSGLVEMGEKGHVEL